MLHLKNILYFLQFDFETLWVKHHYTKVRRLLLLLISS